jgi:2,4-didehydro-3-deoxy-L-rhamnonate hydrolase
MRLARLGPPGDEVPVVLEGAVALDARAVTGDFDGDFFASGGLDRLVRP